MSILNRDSFFRLLSSLAFASGMVSSADSTLLIYYVEERLGFDNADVSKMFLIIGLGGLFAQAVVLKPLNDCVGEKSVVAICFFLGAVDNIMYGLAKTKNTIFVAVAISAFTGMAFPTISAIKANNVVSKSVCARWYL
jgi:DHA1 family tetracycline resistance protein-like MFS transporter